MNKKFLAIPILFIALSLMLTACGTAAPPEEKPADSSKVVLHTTVEGQAADCLNPAFCWIPYNIWEVTYDTLVDWHAVGDPVQGRLAESWDISADGLTWTFHLVDLAGAVFHDGTPMTAEDVAWAINYMARNPGLSWLLWTEVGVNFKAEATDDQTIVLTMDEATNPDAFLSSLVYVYILPRHIWEEYDWTIFSFENTDVIGSGPFMLNEWVPGQHLILDANPDYWGGKPSVDQIIIQVFATPDAQVLALNSGEVNHITDVPPNLADQLENNSNITVVSLPPKYEYHLFFNMWDGGVTHPALTDVHVRQAIAHAIDKDHLLDVVLQGRGVASNSMWDGGKRFDYWAPPDIKSYAFDLKKAGAILDDAGYIDTDSDGIREMNDGSGQPLDFRFFFDAGHANHLPYAESIANWLGEIGIGVELEALESLTLTETALGMDFDLILYLYGFEYDPEYQMLSLSCLGVDWGINFPGYCSPDFDELYYAQHLARNREERREFVFEAQRLIHDEVPWIQLAHVDSYEAYDNRIFNFKITDFQWPGWGWYGIWGIEPNQ